MSGGAPKSQIQHMESMRKNGHEILITISNDIDELKASIGDNINVVEIDQFKINNPLKNIILTYKWIDLLTKYKPDLIVTNRTAQNKFLFAISKITGIPHVPCHAGGNAAIHNIIPLIGANVIVYSKENQKQFANHGHNQKNIFLVSNRIQKKDYFPIVEKSIRPLTILIAGNIKSQTIHGYKFILNHLIDISPYIEKKIRIIIAGKIISNENYLFEITKLLDSLNSYANIQAEYLGWVNNISDIENNSDICIGKGRSIIQPTLKGKIGYVLSEDGFITRISKNTVDKIYEYNFTARGLSKSYSSELLDCINSDELLKEFEDEARSLIEQVDEWYSIEKLYHKLIVPYKLTTQYKINGSIITGILSWLKIYYCVIRFGEKRALVDVKKN